MSLFESASLVVTPNGVKASKLYAIKPTDGSGDLSVVRATTSTRVNSEGLIESVSANVPRLDYSNGSCPSILVEPQRTNLLTYSEGDISTYQSQSGSTSTASLSINGFAESIQVDSDAVDSIAYKRVFTPTVGVEYTLSCFVQMDDNSEPLQSIDNNSGDFGLWVNNSFASSSNDLKTIRIGNTNIYKVSATKIADSTNNRFGVVKKSTQSSKGFRFTAVQLEVGSYATSYIPTTSASVTRNADLINKTGIGSLFGTNKGTVFCDFVCANIQGTSQYIFDTSDGSNATTNRFAFYKIAAGSYELFTNTATSVSINSNTRNKVAITWNGSSVKVYANGVLKNSITYANANPTKINLGTRFNNVEVGDVNYNSYCIFPTDLTDAQLIELTTI